jgi:hypothetical protein
MNEQQLRIAEIAVQSDCAKYRWRNRGIAPAGYIKGMALVYAKCYLESKRSTETAVFVMKQPLQSATTDALAWYETDARTDIERLRALFTLGIGLGMRESSGNTTEGRDITAENPTADSAEAGLFQTSFDSFNISSWFANLFDQYRAGTGTCFLETFKEGVRDKRQPVIGLGPGAEFQRFTKSCPAFAVEYTMVMLRVRRKHFGPITRKEAEYRQPCSDMLKLIEIELDRTQ